MAGTNERMARECKIDHQVHAEEWGEVEFLGILEVANSSNLYHRNSTHLPLPSIPLNLRIIEQESQLCKEAEEKWEQHQI